MKFVWVLFVITILLAFGAIAVFAISDEVSKAAAILWVVVSMIWAVNALLARLAIENYRKRK